MDLPFQSLITSRRGGILPPIKSLLNCASKQCKNMGLDIKVRMMENRLQKGVLLLSPGHGLDLENPKI